MSSEPLSTHTSPREEVFGNEDLLGMIFDFVDVEKSDKGHQFFHIALAHKGFHHAALDFLWKSIPNVLPLLKLIPGFCEVDGVYFLTAPSAKEDDWETFRLYARRVKSITFTHQDETVSPLVYQTLPVYQPLPWVDIGFSLPALRTIRVECAAKTDYSGALFVATASTCILQVEVVDIIPDSFPFLYQLLLVLAHRHSQLEVLELEGKGTDALFRALLPRLSSLSVLKRFSLNFPGVWPLDVEDLQHMSQIGTLASLAIHVSDNDGSDRDLKAPPQKPRFSSLTKLEISGTALVILKALVRTDIPALEHIHLRLDATFCTPHNREFLKRWISFLAQYRHLLTLEVTQTDSSSFSFISTDLFTEPPSSESPSEPLKLQHLHLRMNTMSDTTAFVNLISCSAFPNLTSLILPASTSDPDDKKADLTCLALLAKGCPRLLDVQICLRLHRLTPDQLSEALDIDVTHAEAETYHPLRSLKLSDGGGDQAFGLTDLVSMFKYFHRLFPKLDQLEAYRDAKGRGSGRAEVFEAFQELLLTLKEAKNKGAASVRAKRPKDGPPTLTPQPSQPIVVDTCVQADLEATTDLKPAREDASVQTDMMEVMTTPGRRELRVEDASIQTDMDPIAVEEGGRDGEEGCEAPSMHSEGSVVWGEVLLESGGCERAT
ncbi:hypothetical protein CC1G_07547 [Coprinopsis cinerea okayama7|uniref:Uncharacterized protein n=1 Tax=Coprinopsis cinerea (strain Okayama-7 / 130 / ATCC MYA-4618 / FGSC 9003) TaxID=240176 RepID=A8P199_COPC7|nr:hypothetical protein CC1G_07547 [Coprinopsis cinerea okayama7\|eukprot:XP_001838057.1 hypothetical protein CC1G_07547 [Coprinopsis cinerea okayama7\